MLDHDLSQRALGARIVKGLSSISSPADQRFRSFFSFWSSTSTSSGTGPSGNVQHPAVTLEASLILGDCWRFEGSSGHIAIQLAYGANLTALSVHYIPRSRLGPFFHQNAPKSLTLWGLVRLSEHLTFPALQSTQLHRPISYFARDKQPPSRIVKPGDVFVPLATVHYDVHKDQEMAVAYIGDLEVESYIYDLVVVEVTENWGGDSTCLYHVGVHGQVEPTLLKL
ncbi:hypothetical protein DFP72DRAFT_809461 [Ephemerocybe angulata]|uniref:SUN domain-containing protein n=1 Tax=Ephemerocybe angulata TaxID=980116 RepID=A0A8H6I388_9AGAR|nr:hypothetical protein DFP72DRAFT_809461 [Tulosesus angulatus]